MATRSRKTRATQRPKLKESRARAVRKALRRSRTKATKPQRKPVINREEEEICKKAAIYCLLNFPMLWTVGGIKEEKGEDGSRRWIIAVYLRYPTGHEGYVGDLLYDG